MKIQEMKSGILHLNKKMESERRENFFITQPAAAAIAEPPLERAMPPPAVSELDEPRWSVVSFDRREAGGMKYAHAVDLMAELDSHGVAGLCIVTDDAAHRIRA